MIHVQQVEDDKLRDREEFKIKKAKTSGNESRHQKRLQTGHLSNISKRDVLHHLLVHPHQGTNSGRNRGTRAQSSSVAPPDKGAPRGATLGTGGGINHLYAITRWQEQNNSPNVVNGMIKVLTFDVYALLDSGASLSFVTPYVAMNFNILPEQLLKPFSVYTHVGECILAKRVYRDCTISVYHKETMADLVELDMIDFDVIQLLSGGVL
ncbi:hypothetical protein H5410_060773 [Solanum commersonii]|uniref:Gag-pol polyprotein n=1 Tax=Solanum commersonii TaxID=4109 RepID=A0A9J5W6N9_SOLCO|nr:hypothetical protein H5410_060773 [Solanum commersonii]